MMASRTSDETSPSKRLPAKLPTIDLSTICRDETAVLAQDGQAAIASVTGEADDHCRKTDGDELDVRASSRSASAMIR
jgi:hypothetical protein